MDFVAITFHDVRCGVWDEADRMFDLGCMPDVEKIMSPFDHGANGRTFLFILFTDIAQ